MYGSVRAARQQGQRPITDEGITHHQGKRLVRWREKAGPHSPGCRAFSQSAAPHLSYLKSLHIVPFMCPGRGRGSTILHMLPTHRRRPMEVGSTKLG